ncbi:MULTISPECIES: hypothetical protein [unclassified Bradyrhizobium]|uniref:hypothetical protein n=1 Tax=unclassified Bradyrhizobium TaxID=2631580 RepID=UPI00247B2710|nr:MULTISPECIES: hypothetical protein [unclassified Bradyrhizobium]WGS18967.1 hypothetical protein MTX22_31330 [Bradyrhizobium sp. ISRA463]WGS25801.1 hypothetical protein MTX19_28895 [Bradyrhizobium sp. ISRA464]
MKNSSTSSTLCKPHSSPTEGAAQPADIRRTRASSTGLHHLPSPDELDLAGQNPWGVVGTKILAKALSVDRALLNVWHYRTILPPPMPRKWFRTNTLVFRVDHILAWLGDTREPHEIWRPHLRKIYGDQTNDLSGDEVCRLTAHLVDLLGRGSATPEGINWKDWGFNEYVLSLASTAGVMR